MAFRFTHQRDSQKRRPSDHVSAEGPSQVLVGLPLALQRWRGFRIRTLDETGEHLLCLNLSRDVPCASCDENQRIYLGKAVFFVTEASQKSQRIEERNARGVNRFGLLNRIRLYSDLDWNEV